jgi:hypothetical protein
MADKIMQWFTANPGAGGIIGIGHEHHTRRIIHQPQ